jgi:tRNA (guanine-N1)-methyltransferase
VPEVLTSGNFKAIDEWLMQQAMEKTLTRRPDLIKKNENQ